MDEIVLGPAVSLADLKPGQACVIVRDCTGGMFVREATEDDIVGFMKDAL